MGLGKINESRNLLHHFASIASSSYWKTKNKKTDLKEEIRANIIHNLPLLSELKSLLIYSILSHWTKMQLQNPSYPGIPESMWAKESNPICSLELSFNLWLEKKNLQHNYSSKLLFLAGTFRTSRTIDIFTHIAMFRHHVKSWEVVSFSSHNNQKRQRQLIPTLW